MNGLEVIKRDIGNELVAIGGGDDLGRLANLWRDSLGLLEEMRVEVGGEGSKQGKFLDMVMYLRGMKLSAEVARILLDFVPKGEGESEIEKLAKELGL